MSFHDHLVRTILVFGRSSVFGHRFFWWRVHRTSSTCCSWRIIITIFRRFPRESGIGDDLVSFSGFSSSITIKSSSFSIWGWISSLSPVFWIFFIISWVTKEGARVVVEIKDGWPWMTSASFDQIRSSPVPMYSSYVEENKNTWWSFINIKTDSCVSCFYAHNANWWIMTWYNMPLWSRWYDAFL